MKWLMVNRLLLALCCLLSAAPIAAQGSYHEDNRDNITISTSCIMPKALVRGYVPVKIQLTNHRKEAVELELELGNLNNWDTRVATSGTIELDSGQSASMEWLAYYMPSSHSYDRVSLRIRADGQYLTRHTALQLDSSSAAKLMEPMLAVGDIPKAIAGSFNGLSVFDGREIRAEGCEASDLPSDWRAYTSLRMVAIDMNAKAPDAAALEAILDWTSTGGILLLIGTEQQAQRFMAAQGDFLQQHKLLSGGPNDRARCKIYRHRFGRIVTSGGGTMEAQGPKDYLPLVGWHLPANFQSANTPPSGTFPSEVMKARMQIPGLRTAPIAVLILVLLFFSFIVGPWQLKRQKRKHLSPFRFLFLTPLLGFGFTVVILMTSMFSQGIGVQEAVTSVTWLDQQTHKATTMAKRLTFSGSVFRSELNYSGRTVAAPWPKGSSRRNSREFVINMDREGVLEGYFLPVRIPTEQMVASVANARGRVEIESEGGVHYATNGLDVELQDFYYLDQFNKWHQVPSGDVIGVNQRVRLLPTDVMPDYVYPLLPEIEDKVKTDEEAQAFFAHLPFGQGQRRSYVARIPHSPFLEDGGIERSIKTQAHLLIGSLPAEAGQ